MSGQHLNPLDNTYHIILCLNTTFWGDIKRNL
jgi:hypothetical protein